MKNVTTTHDDDVDNEFSWYQELQESLPLTFLDGRIANVKVHKMALILYTFDGESYYQPYDEVWGVHLEFPSETPEQILERVIISRTPPTPAELAVPQYVSFHPVLGKILHLQRGAYTKTFFTKDLATAPVPRPLEADVDFTVSTKGSLFLIESVSPCPTPFCVLAYGKDFILNALGVDSPASWKLIAHEGKPLVCGHADPITRLMDEGNDRNRFVYDFDTLNTIIEG